MNQQTVHRRATMWPWVITLGVLAASLLLWHRVSQLRHENESLRTQSLESSVARQGSVSEAGSAMETDQSGKDRLELLRLRGEVTQLREQLARLGPNQPAIPVQPPVTGPSQGQDGDSEIQQLGVAAMRGDAGALNKLAKLAVASRTMDTNAQASTRSALRQVFDALGTQAGQGNAAALQAVWQASRMPELQGFAVVALGQAAGQGNEDALKPLLDPDSYLITRSSAVAALKPAADAGNARAIQALAATATDPNQHGLWLLAAQGLETAAASGSGTAIDGLATLAGVEDQNVRKYATLALETAARNNQPRAEEALRKLGWR